LEQHVKSYQCVSRESLCQLRVEIGREASSRVAEVHDLKESVLKLTARAPAAEALATSAKAQIELHLGTLREDFEKHVSDAICRESTSRESSIHAIRELIDKEGVLHETQIEGVMQQMNLLRGGTSYSELEH